MTDDSYIKEAASLMDQAKTAISGGMDSVKGLAAQAQPAISSGMDSLRDMAGKVSPALSSGVDSVRDLVNKPEVQKLLPYLLAGGAGAAAGGLMTSGRKKREGESRGGYLARVLRNAAVTAAAVGGGSYLASEGFKKTIGAADLANPITGSADDAGPLSESAKSTLFSPVTAGLAGATGLAATTKLPGRMGIFGANPGAADAEKSLMARVNTNKTTAGIKVDPHVNDVKSLGTLGKEDPLKFRSLLLGGKSEIPAAMASDARKVGLNLHDPSAPLSGLAGKAVNKVDGLVGNQLAKLPAGRASATLKSLLSGRLGKMTTGLGSKAHEMGRLPSMLFGRTAGRRALRGGIGGLAALTPALLGSILSNPAEKTQ